MARTCLLAALLALPFAQQGSGQDDKILERADKLLEEAKAGYEDARTRSSVPAFVDAGFKLEEARIKYIVLQEIGSAEKQKIATDRLRAVNQLAKLIHDGKVAVAGTPADAPAPPKPGEPAAPAPAPDAPPAKPPVDVTKRVPIPEQAKQKDAEKMVKDLFKDQYSRKAPADRIALAKALLTQATKISDDPVALWVLLREAHDLAVQNGDLSIAMSAIESAAKDFDVDALPMKAAAIATLGKSAKTPAESAGLAEALNGLIDEMIATDQYDAAEKAAASALQHSRRANDPSLLARATSRVKEVSEAKSKYTSMKSVLQTLARTPDDPGANLEMGQFLCFVKGNWDLGLRFLVKGSDAALRSMAEKDLAAPSQPSEQMALADAWWDLAEKEKSPLRKGQMLARAKALYEVALPGATGLGRPRIEKRLEQLGTSVGTSLNLLKMIDLKIDGVSGIWTLEKEVLACEGTSFGRVQIPYQPPDEYDLTLVVNRRSGTDGVIIGLVGGGTQFSLIMDGFSGEGGASLLEMFDGGVPMDRNPTAAKGLVIPQDKATTVVCVVRKKGVTVMVNGKKLLGYEGEYRRLSINPAWAVPEKRALFVGNFNTALHFTKLTLTPVTGQGKKLR